MKDLAVRRESMNDLVKQQDDEIYERVAREGESLIHGDHLQFKKGFWYRAKQLIGAEPDARFVVNLDESLRGHQRWRHKKPCGYPVVAKIIDPWPPAPPEPLDQDQWEKDEDG